MNDPAFDAEVSALLDRVLDLVTVHQTGEKAGPSQRFVIEVPDAWVTLAAWLEMRRRMRLTERHGVSPPVRLDETSSRLVRDLARRYVRTVIHENMHSELHELAKGTHPFLRQPVDACSGGRDDEARA